MNKLLRILPSAVFSLLVGCQDVTLPANVRGVTHIDKGTDYVYLKEPSHVGGHCEGWSTLRIARSGEYGVGKDNLICWREAAGFLYVTTKEGKDSVPAKISTMLDIAGEP